MSTTRTARVSFIATALAAAVTAPLAAVTTPPTWNRQAEAISVTPGIGAAYTIEAAFSVDAADVVNPLNLGTRVFFSINGTVVASPQMGITANPAGSGCGGQFCATFQPCICCHEGCFCGGGFVARLSTSHVLAPGDEISIILRPMVGALADTSAVDDTLDLTFDGELVYWNRSLTAPNMTTVVGSSSITHTISAELHAVYQGPPLMDPMDLSTQVQILRNGSPVSTQDVSITVSPIPVIAGGAVPCGGSCPWHLFCYCGGSLDCTCGEFVFWFNYSGHFDPGDEISVILLPAPGALPEVFAPDGDDDEILVGIVPGPSPADLNHDGIVNTLDLGIMLSNWSIPATAPGCHGVTPCAADLNHDGRVNSLDLGMLLTAWTL